MAKRLSILVLTLVVGLAVGCTKSGATAENTTQPGPDNSEIITKVDDNGVKTEERVFHNNPRIARVVVTTRSGNRTVKAYSPSGEEREVNRDGSDNVLSAAGDKVADAAGFVAEKSVDVGEAAKNTGEKVGEKTVDTAKDVGQKTADKTKEVGSKTADTAKDVGSKTEEGAKTVKEKTVEGAKTVGSKTAEGTKKVGRAVKKIIP
ncbi:MAG TPA: hypothetical protein VI306_00055 [Pyrinomonadaceae bacterium]